MSGLTGVTNSSRYNEGVKPQTYRSVDNVYGQQQAVARSQDLFGPAYELDIANWQSPEVRQLKQTGRIECQTCNERRYQDVSNDPGVSFKAPGHISPESSGAVVRSHEQEHVVNEQTDAKQEGREVVSQSVRTFSAVCPECGRVYVSGGETRTTTKASQDFRSADPVGGQVDLLA